MPETKNNPYRYLPHILFLFLEMATIGTYVVAFLITFLTFDELEFTARYLIYQKCITYNAVIGGMAALLFSVSLTLRKSSKPETIDDFKLQSKILTKYALFVILMLMILLFNYLGLVFHALDLFSLLFTVYLLMSISHKYSTQFQRPAWQHPTTSGMFIEGSLLLGLAVSMWLFKGKALSIKLGWIMLIIMAFEILTLWGRFQFLSKATPVTRKSVQMMLGSHLALFGIRFIFGIIMPMVYLFWALIISSALPLEPVILMIIVGEISERILLFVSSEQTVLSSDHKDMLIG